MKAFVRGWILYIATVFVVTSAASAQGTWSTAGRLISHRERHTATLLPTGEVLVVGGFGGRDLLSSAELYNSATGKWTSTGDLATPRTRHTATLLPTGRVLVAGGLLTSGFSSAELYNPTTKDWVATQPLITSRYGHTATLLRNGKVLVVGGFGSEYLNSAELYDPTADTWSRTGSLAVARAEHTAALLPNGKVLVAGGYNGAQLSATELYDPLTETWSTTGFLGAARDHHTCTVLQNGKVLVTGGDFVQARSSAELYDPSVGRWTTTSSLTGLRDQHTATLLANGKVLVVGGFHDIFAEQYDPATGVWTNAGTLAARRESHTATLLPNGQVLVSAGFGGGILASAELYDADVGYWSATGALPAERGDHTATILASGNVLVAGGQNFNVSFDSALLYQPRIGKWLDTGSLLTARCDHTATLLPNGKVLVAGGTFNNTGLSSAELYDPATGSWRATGSMNHVRRLHTATLLANGQVLVAGGYDGSSSNTSEIYDPATGVWRMTGLLLGRRSEHTATLLATGEVLIVGGQGDESNVVSELYNPLLETWRATGSLGIPRTWHAATLLPSGKVLVMGGFSAGTLTSAELYDPTTESWTPTGSLVAERSFHTATLLANGKVLVVGGADLLAELYDLGTETWTAAGGVNGSRGDRTATLLPNGDILVAGGTFTSSAYLYTQALYARPKPVLNSVSSPITFGTRTVIAAASLSGVSEGSNGSTTSSPFNYPLFQIRSVDSSQIGWLIPDPLPSFSDDPMTITFSRLPPTLDAGWAYVTPITSGIPGESQLVEVRCGLIITRSPANITVDIGRQATFLVEAQGGRHYQWEKNAGTGWIAVGSDQPSYTTEPTAGVDSGTRYRVTVKGACSSATSAEAVVTISDATPPVAAIVSPTGGEYWLLSTAGNPPNTRLVAWSMSDNVRVCRVAASLLYSTDGGTTYVFAAPSGGLPATFGTSGTCAFPGETTTSVTYTMPTAFPAGRAGALYKIQVIVTDHAGNSTKVESANPFYIVQANPDSVKTLILWNSSRMVSRQGISAQQTALLSGKLQELANHPRVQGVVVDIGGITSTQNLYAAWDADPSNTSKANVVLFGAGGIHEHLRTSLLPTYSGVKYVVIVGDDRIVPMARIEDRTALLPESRYPAGGDLSPTQTTVGQALAAGKYLSDDPLAVLDPIATTKLEDNLYLPDLSIGRLVETPQEIVTTIATYIGQDGILDLSLVNPTTGHKVLITGYDFLSGVAQEIRERWKTVLRASTPDSATAPVDGSLIGGNWSIGSVPARANALRMKLSGNGGTRYGIMALAGHATHYEEGVPGTDPFDIQGLSAADIYGADACGTPSAGSINLAGGVIYAVGCHGGLSVPGSCRTDVDRSLDLPQTMLNRGAVAYIANSGYGWGLRFGIGYSARLVQIFTEQMTSRGSVTVGDLVRETKQRYYLETPRYDPYDEKTVMQWILYGLPMYVVKTGVATTPAQQTAGTATPAALGAVRVRRELSQLKRGAAALALPSSLTQLNLSFDFTAPGVFDKHGSAGNLVAGQGCPDPNGCYYTLNGLVDRGTGSADLPIQPYLIYDSRLSGSSQHGALWKGGTYDEETGWRPVVAELISNGGDGSNHGPSPRHIRLRPTTPRVTAGADAPDCRTTDLELNTLVVTAGEAAKNQDSDPTYSITRLYRTTDIEVFYFNNRTTPTDNCDRDGPALALGPFGGQYHQVSGTTVSWAVPATDAAGVWRVLVVYNPNTVDTQGRGRWIPLELTNDGSGTFHGNVAVSGSARLTYLLQAVDNRGNITWLEYTSTSLPSSGVPLGVPKPVDVEFSNERRRRAVRH